MRIAETTGRSSLLVLGTLALGTLIAAAVTLPGDGPPTERRAPVRKMRGCGGHAPRLTVPAAPAPASTGDVYADVLRSARDELSACLHPEHAQLRLELTIASTGRVALWQVNVTSGDFEGVDEAAMECLQSAVAPLQFPATDHEVKVSTHLVPRR